MKGDFSRFTFNSKNRYSRVLMQQGRVQLDADWNEQLDISAYRTETEIADFIGQSGAPESPLDLDAQPAYSGDLNYQSSSFRITARGDKILIGKGRYYIEGMLFENDDGYNSEKNIVFTAQPDLPGEALPTKDGLYLAYLDVWQHHVTALEVPALREVALGGADTTTRVKNVWRVKLHRLEDNASLNPGDYASNQWQPDWEVPISQGDLTAGVQQPGTIVENQLYRIEIHQGNATEADRNKPVTFKWSRDNGAIAAQVEIVGSMITIQHAGRDSQLAFPINQLVEFSNASRMLKGEPGVLATVRDVQGNRLIVDWKTLDQQPPANSQNLTIVRRWDCTDELPIDQVQPLEQSIIVQLDSGVLYKTGDYWLIPARALTGAIEWSSDSPRPHGVRHCYCSLALLQLKNNQFSVIADCRSIFKPITSGLVSKAGDTIKGDLSIDRNLYIARNVGIGTKSPTSQLSVTGGVAIGPTYANLQTASGRGLLVEGEVAIGNVVKMDSNSTEQVSIVEYLNRKSVGSDANLVVRSKTVNYIRGVSPPPAPPGQPPIPSQPARAAETEPALTLVRDGVNNASWPNRVDFRIGKYELRGHNSSTRLDILLADGVFNENQPDGWIKPVMTLQANGNVGIGTTSPQAKLEVNGNVSINGTDAAFVIGGKIGNWTAATILGSRESVAIQVIIKPGSQNNLIPIYSPNRPIGSVTVLLEAPNIVSLIDRTNYIATCQAVNSKSGAVTYRNSEPISRPNGDGFIFTIGTTPPELLNLNYVLITVCLATRI